MTASSASLPQRRRDALRQQLVDARSQGDQLAIKRIERQWVHRYGVEALSQLTSEPLALADQSEGPASAGNPDELASMLHAFSADASDVVILDESLNAAADDAEPACMEDGRDLSCETDPSGEADASGEELSGEALSGEAFVAAQRLSGMSLVALEQVPPPPVPRLHRLRRWIPTAANGLPKAS